MVKLLQIQASVVAAAADASVDVAFNLTHSV